MNKVLIIGKGGREHALAWKFASYNSVEQVFCAPGNPGIAKESKVSTIPVEADNIEELLKFAKEEKITLTVIGPEAPLVEGIVDRFNEVGLKCFGPTKEAAKLEGSKVYAKEFFERHGIPSAKYDVFSDFDTATEFLKQRDFPIVIKVDGLAAGKGVSIVKSLTEAELILDDIFHKKVFGSAGSKIIIEDFISGEELSYICMINPFRYLSFASSQDHKARDDGDNGPNTGGMGAYSPANLMDNKLEKKILDTVIEPTIKGIQKDGLEFTGFLYAGLMINEKNEIKVLEFNCRFGDPEAQPVLMRLKSNLFDACLDLLNNKNEFKALEFDPKTAITIVLAADGYPGEFIKDIEIPESVDEVNSKDNGVKIFHAGTYTRSNKVFSGGGRVLNVSCMSESLLNSRSSAYEAIKKIQIKNLFFRKDIGQKGL